jgi:hypothetical protein
MHSAYLRAPADDVPESPAGVEFARSVEVVVDPTLATPGLAALFEQAPARSETAPSAKKKAALRRSRTPLAFNLGSRGGRLRFGLDEIACQVCAMG